jgi:nucleotide-binding universal stress UspA family protein
METIAKHIVIPIDGSKNSLNSLDYLSLMFPPAHPLEVSLVYILPTLPPLLTADEDMDAEIYAELTRSELKLLRTAERVLNEAKGALLERGFPPEKIKMVQRKRHAGFAQDICRVATDQRTDAILMTRRGQMGLDAVFMGRVSSSLLECCQDLPVWISGGQTRSRGVLLCIDPSENALRTVDHAGFMLSGTDVDVTLFHSLRNLRRFVPEEVIEDAPQIQALWGSKAGEQIRPYMEKAKRILTRAGLSEEQISVRIVGGSRSPADDILNQAREGGYGTIALGRRGVSGIQAFLFGSVTRKIVQQGSGFTIWIVQ